MFYKKLFLTVVFVVAILVVNFFVFNHFLEGTIFSVSKPLFTAITERTISLSLYGKNLFHTSQLGDQVHALKEENSKLLNSLARLNQLQEENDSLKTRLNLVGSSKSQLIFADIFSIRGEMGVAAFLINKGSDDGVEDGFAVVTAENVLAGVVSKTYKKSSLVLMPQNKTLVLNVQISGTNTLARSQSDGQRVILDFVTSQDEIKTGDLVVTSGLDKVPESIPVFKISNINPVQGNLFQEVIVTPIFELLHTHKVFIIK